MTGYFDNKDDCCNIKYSGLDTRKAYTANFMEIEMYPIFDYFDIWKVYDDHKIEDHNQYIVRCKSTKSEHLVLLSNMTSRRVTGGFKLNRLTENISYQILSYKRPSKLVTSSGLFCVPLDIRTSFRVIVRKRMCAHIKERTI
jgi:hypothetical protein